MGPTSGEPQAVAEPIEQTPAPATPTETPAEGKPLPDTDFEQLVAEFERDAAGEETEPTAATPPPTQQGATEPTAAIVPSPPEPVPAAAPVQPTVEPTPVVAPAAAQPQVTATPPMAPQVPATPAPKAMTPDEMKQARESLIEQISSSYKLSEDDKAALITDPDKVLPKLTGRLFVDVLESVVRVVTAQMPQIVEQQVAARTAAQGARNAFFKQFPALNKPEYIPTIQQVTAAVRQMNPQVPYEQAVEKIGKMSMALLNLPVEGTSHVTPPVNPPLRPATPVLPGAAATRPAAAPKNEWDDLARFELIDE